MGIKWQEIIAIKNYVVNKVRANLVEAPDNVKFLHITL